MTPGHSCISCFHVTPCLSVAYYWCWKPMPHLEFFLNGAELSLNSVNSANSGNLINQWRKEWAEFKDAVPHMCLAGTAVAFWSLTHWIQWKYLEKTPMFKYKNSNTWLLANNSGGHPQWNVSVQKSHFTWILINSGGGDQRRTFIRKKVILEYLTTKGSSHMNVGIWLVDWIFSNKASRHGCLLPHTTDIQVTKHSGAGSTLLLSTNIWV